MDLSPVVQRTLSDEAGERIRDAIRRGSLAPGARLVERDLAQKLGVSRIPIREAIQRLVEEGLVKKTPHRGTIVYVPSADEIEEISSLRAVLERFVVERVLARWTNDHEARLCRIVDEMANAASERAFQQVYESDFQFHYTLWEIADHSILHEVVFGLRSRISRFLYEAVTTMPSSQLSFYVESHNTLLEVLRTGDMAASQLAITQHIVRSKNRILAYYERVTKDSHAQTVAPDTRR